MAEVDTGIAEWLPYDMDILAAIENTTNLEPLLNDAGAMDWQTGGGGGSVLSVPPPMAPEERDVMALYGALGVPLLTPTETPVFIHHPYEERETPGKAKRGKKAAAAPAVPFVDGFTPPPANTGKRVIPTTPEAILADTQAKLTDANTRNQMLQRQVSKTLELVRAITTERDAVREQLAQTKAELAAAKEHVAWATATNNSSSPAATHTRARSGGPPTKETTPAAVVPSRAASNTPPAVAHSHSPSPAGVVPGSTVATSSLMTGVMTHESSPDVDMDSTGRASVDSASKATEQRPCAVAGLKFTPGAWERQHQAYDKIADVCARPEASDEECMDAIRAYCAASLQQNFVLRDEVDAVCSPQFMMRNMFINNNGSPWAEPSGERLERNLAKWGQIMKGCHATQQQFERFVEFSVRVRREVRLIMEERHVIVTELMEFFASKIAYFQRMFMSEEETNSTSLMRAASLLSRLRVNLLKYVDTWGSFIFHDLREIFSGRQLAQIYYQARKCVIYTTDALEAVNALAQNAEGESMKMDVGGGMRL